MTSQNIEALGHIGPEAIIIGVPLVIVAAVLATWLALRWARKDPAARRQRLGDFLMGMLSAVVLTMLAMKCLFPALQILST
jgi:hydrogenase-4 membrane subunit HyfE